MLLTQERELVRQYCIKMYDRGLTVGTSGNISIFNRDQGLLAISPSSVNYHIANIEDIVVMDLGGKIVQGDRRPSTEWKMHLVQYQRRADINAVIHSHPPYATACACLQRDVPAVHGSITLTKDEIIPCAKYGFSGSEELAEYMYEAMQGRTAALVNSHGLMVGAKDIARAMMITEELEFVCKMYILTESVGGAPVLPREKLQFWG